MLLFIIFTLVAGFTSFFKLPDSLAALGMISQKNCAEQVPTSTAHAQFVSAMICGTDIKDPDLYKILTETSLIHVAVVSGSHLSALSQLLEKALGLLRLPSQICSGLKYTFLFLYCFLCGFQPPVVRSFFSQLFQNLAQHYRFWRRSDLGIWWSLIFCLALMPPWIASASLRMSVMAAVGLELSSSILIPLRKHLASRVLRFIIVLFLQSLFVQILMCAFLGSFHWRSVFFNCVFAPVLCWILLPLCLAIFVFPASATLLDAVFSGTFALLNWALQLDTSPGWLLPPLPTMALWMFILAFTLAALSYPRWRDQRGNQI